MSMKLKNSKRGCPAVIVFILLSLVFVASGVRTATAEEDDRYNPDLPIIEAELRDKYEIEKVEFRVLPKGILNVIHILGDLTPPGIEKRGNTLEDKRQMALAFLEEESPLIGFDKVKGFDLEFREYDTRGMLARAFEEPSSVTVFKYHL